MLMPYHVIPLAQVGVNVDVALMGVTIVMVPVDTDGSLNFVSSTGFSVEDICSGCGVYNGCGCNLVVLMLLTIVHLLWCW